MRFYCSRGTWQLDPLMGLYPCSLKRVTSAGLRQRQDGRALKKNPNFLHLFQLENNCSCFPFLISVLNKNEVGNTDAGIQRPVALPVWIACSNESNR